jgi:hypothetical protein
MKRISFNKKLNVITYMVPNKTIPKTTTSTNFAHHGPNLPRRPGTCTQQYHCKTVLPASNPMKRIIEIITVAF